MDIKLHLPTRSKSFNITFLLLILAIFDSIVTDFGISNNYISEANPLMRIIYETSVPGFYAIKIILPLLLMYFISKFEPKSYLQLLIAAALFLYAFVLFQHIYWLYLTFLAT